MRFGWILAIFLFLTASFLAGLLTPVMKRIAIKFSILDSPSEAHKTHLSAIPYLGGVGIIITVVLISTLASLLSSTPRLYLSNLAWVLVPALFMGIIGLIDDVRRLTPWPRFLAQNLVGFIVAGILILTNTVGSPTGSAALDFAISIFWIVGLTNAVNFFDNIDGGASGTIAISSLFLGVLSLQGNQSAISALAFVLSGSTVGFLFWNKPPARIYMGDAGALFLGLLVASLTLRFDPNPINKWAGFAVPFFLLALPIMDTTVAVLSRVMNARSPFQGGRDHLSHRLMKMGIKKRAAVGSLWTISVFFSLMALIISQVSYSAEGIVALLGFIIWLFMFMAFYRLPTF